MSNPGSVDFVNGVLDNVDNGIIKKYYEENKNDHQMNGKEDIPKNLHSYLSSIFTTDQLNLLKECLTNIFMKKEGMHRIILYGQGEGKYLFCKWIGFLLSKDNETPNIKNKWFNKVKNPDFKGLVIDSKDEGTTVWVQIRDENDQVIITEDGYYFFKFTTSTSDIICSDQYYKDVIDWLFPNLPELV